ncbi:MAG: EamA family transporter [Candidatus Gracilibacteria bacterium]|nr:EamA family transporter [Candidatus Gracilibacteria bacterium]
MELWFIYAVLSAIFVGIYKFLNKIIAKKGINKNNFLLYVSLTQIFINIIYVIYTESYFYMTLLFGVLIILRTIFSTELAINMIKSLKYIDSSLFFPSNHIIKMGGGFIIGMYVFGESLNSNEIIFLFFGIISVIFLGYKKGEYKNKDFKKGIYFMILSSLFLVGTSSINKYIGENESITLYMLLSSIFSVFYILYKIKIKKEKIIFNKTEFNYGLLLGILGFFGFAFYLNAMTDGKLVVVQLISTITTLIPIILSYIFLKEEVNRFRIIGLILFLVNLGIFYVNK